MYWMLTDKVVNRVIRELYLMWERWWRTSVLVGVEMCIMGKTYNPNF